MGGECAEGNEFFEGSVDTVGLDVAMKEAPDLILRQSGVGCLDGLANTVGNGVPGGHAEEEGGTGVAVIPYGEGSLEMGQADDGGGVQGRVDGAETQDDEEIQAVAGGIDHAVGSRADQVAECGQKLEENGGRVGLGMGSDGADGESCETVESGFAQLWIRRGRGGER